MQGQNSEKSKHRLRRKDLVMKVFYFFSEEYEAGEKESIWDLEIPMSDIREYLLTQHGVSYNSNQWIYTQLRRYEDEIGVKLFKKDRNGGGRDNFSIAIHENMIQFYQKQHLYVSQKLKVVNGVYDLIRHEAHLRMISRPIRLLLGAGSTVYHLADILARNSWTDQDRYDIYTHNLGSLQSLLNHTVNYDKISLSILSGTIDPVTYTIEGTETGFFSEKSFDFIIQGTSCVYDGELYIESHQEYEIKRAILHQCEGTKILVLTKHEFHDSPLENTQPYGKISDYDFVVVPRRVRDTGHRKKYDLRFEECLELMKPEIQNWNYCIYSMK